MKWWGIESDELDLGGTPAAALLRRAEKLREQARQLEAEAHEALVGHALAQLVVRPVRLAVVDPIRKRRSA